MEQPKTLRVLVVDDEEIVRYTIEMILEHLGHQAHCVGEGNSGLKALETKHFDAAIVDIRMPGLDGIDFLSLAWEIQPGIPVIMVSGHASEEIRDKVLQAGALAFLAKPFQISDLEQLLKKI